MCCAILIVCAKILCKLVLSIVGYCSQNNKSVIDGDFVHYYGIESLNIAHPK